LAKLAWLALPLGLVMMLISLNTNIPRYFVQRYLGERGLGIFAAIAYLQVAGTTVVGALGRSASPRLARYYATGDGPSFRRLLLKLAGIGALLGGAGVLAALVAGRELLTLLYGPEYVQRDTFAWLMVAAGIAYVASFLGYGMTAARYFRIQLPLFALVTAATGMACLLLVPAYGLRGVAVALVISSIVQAGCSLAVVAYALWRLRRSTGGYQGL
jgi:O-antigen/teichoic acid export membrane protein